MSNEIIKVLDNLAERFGVAIDWTAQNVMPYLQDLYGRIIDYRIMQLSIMYIISILGLIISLALFVKNYRDYNTVSKNIEKLEKNKKIVKLFWSGEHRYEFSSNEPEMNFAGMVLSAIAGFLLTLSITSMFVNTFELIEIINIPEKYVLDMVQGMM